MINTEKVRLMTKVTEYEKSVGAKEIKINRYQQSTYVGLQLLKSFVITSVVFGLSAILVAAYLVLSVVSKGQMASIGEVCLKFLALYGIGLIVSLSITWYEGRKRYRKSKKNIENYDRDLLELEQYFEEEGNE